MTSWLTLRALVFLRRLVRCEEARLEIERARFERDYPPLLRPGEPRKAEISRPTIEQMNKAYHDRQAEREREGRG